MNTSALRICHRQMLLKMNFGFRSIQLAKIMIFSTYPRLIYLVSFDPLMISCRLLENSDFSGNRFRTIEISSFFSFRRNFWILAKYLEALPEKCGNNSIRPDRFELFQRTRIKKWNDPQVSSTFISQYFYGVYQKFRLTKKKEDTAYVFRQLKLIKNRKDSDKPKKMRIYHIQVKSNAPQKDMKFWGFKIQGFLIFF